MKASVGRRVLMVVENDSYPRDSRVHKEADTLVAVGYQVSVISPAHPGQPWYETIDNVRVYRYSAPSDGHSFLGYLWEYGYATVATFLLSLIVLLREGFDILHTANPPDTFVLVAAFYKLLGKRYIYDHHDLAPEMYLARFNGKGNLLVYHILICFERLSCRLADHVIATNQSYKAVEMQRGCVPEERITIVRNGPDLDRLRLVEPDQELRQKGKTIIGYVGVMGFQDGVDYFLRALRHLICDLGRTNFYCVLIGKGDAWTTLRQTAVQLGISQYVWFTGRVSDADLIRYLSTVDICVDPDPSNSFTDRSTMIKMMEYMALGKPIVAFDLPEHRYTAQDAALYVRPNDELEFARALTELMDDPLRGHEMGVFGRRRVETDLAWDHSVPHLVAAYDKLLAKSHPGEVLSS